MEKVKVSIIVPCYNVEAYLPNCIESVLHQSYPHWELILVDDGSPDRCGEMCDKYAQKDNRMKGRNTKLEKTVFRNRTGSTALSRSDSFLKAS